jgi:hypothetical protein
VIEANRGNSRWILAKREDCLQDRRKRIYRKSYRLEFHIGSRYGNEIKNQYQRLPCFHMPYCQGSKSGSVKYS